MVARRVGGDGLCALKVPSSNGRTFFRVKGIEMDIGIMSEAEWNRVFYASAPTEVGAEVFYGDYMRNLINHVKNIGRSIKNEIKRFTTKRNMLRNKRIVHKTFTNQTQGGRKQIV